MHISLDSAHINIPVYIISFNRKTYLKRLVEWLERKNFRNITIVDNNSTYPPLLEYLTSLPYRVVRLEENFGHLAVWKCGKFADILAKKFFIVTDPDILPEETCPDDVIMRFQAYLAAHPRITKCGFSLRIDDIPECHPLRASIIKVEREYWKNPLPDGSGFFAPIDTTFALYRPGITPNDPRWFDSIRLAPPYIARHLPWYKNPDAPDEEILFYKNTVQIQSTFWTASDSASLKRENLALRERIAELETQTELLSKGIGDRMTVILYKILRNIRKKLLSQ
ncbi:MAG: glycosyltransferase [Desulfovibrio sp.]|jgi:glycosyltransferase involved in cell wall biosynthesis|nr:glycosyltransferase [Desulfovibrio sp.]